MALVNRGVRLSSRYKLPRNQCVGTLVVSFSASCVSEAFFRARPPNSEFRILAVVESLGATSALQHKETKEATSVGSSWGVALVAYNKVYTVHHFDLCSIFFHLVRHTTATKMSEILSSSPGERKEDWIPLTADELEQLAVANPMKHDPPPPTLDSTTAMEVATPIETSDSSITTSASSRDLKSEVKIIQELGDLVVQPTTTSPIQDPLVQSILRGLDENVKKLQGVVDDHVKPHIVKAKTVVDKHVGKHVQPHLEKAHESVRPHLDNASKNWQTLSSSTRSLMDEKVKPGLEGFKKGTVEGFENVKKGTVEGFENVKKGTVDGLEHVKRGTVEGFETVKKGTVQGFETSKQVLIDLPIHSKRAIDEHVLPVVENVKVGTKATLDTISTKSIESYQTHVLPHVEKAHQVHTTYESCYMGRAPGLFAEDESRPLVILAEACLRSYGKVIFCDNPVTGGCMWLAMLVGSPATALSSLACVISLTYTAKFLEVSPDDELRRGSLGVNAVLVGAGASAFLNFENPFMGWFGSLILATFFLPPITLLVSLHCQRSSLFQGTAESPSVPILLLPYNIVMVAFLLASLLWDRSLVRAVATEDAAVETSVILAIVNGLSKIFLVEGRLSGILILVGTLLCSRILAVSLLSGSIMATLLGWSFGMPAMVLNGGVAGYNAALTTAAMAYYFEPSWTLVVVGVFVVVLSGLCQAACALFFWDTLYVGWRIYCDV